jgi:hypothetical protein
MLYLLSIDLGREKVPDRKKIGYVLRAGALVDLGLRGNLADVDGKVHVTSTEATGDPVLDKVLGEISRDRERKWTHWVRHHDSDTLDAVENQLACAGVIKVHQRTLLADKVETLDAAAVVQLRQRVLSTLTSAQHIEDLDPYDVALTAMAANGELSTAIPNKERRAHKDRVTGLTNHIGTSAPALKKLVTELHSVRTSAGWVGAANAAASG